MEEDKNFVEVDYREVDKNLIEEDKNLVEVEKNFVDMDYMEDNQNFVEMNYVEEEKDINLIEEDKNLVEENYKEGLKNFVEIDYKEDDLFLIYQNLFFVDYMEEMNFQNLNSIFGGFLNKIGHLNFFSDEIFDEGFILLLEFRIFSSLTVFF